MTSPPEESSPSSAAAVQPSATLIEALRHKLCDPSIVPNFERVRAPHVTQRLLTSRWVLQSNNNDAAQSSSSKIDDDDDVPTATTQNTHDNKKYNQVPTRNYLDIRIEQNTTFANEQCLRCQKKLAVLSSSTKHSIDYVKNKKQIKKITDTIRSHLNEGLAACPNHDGLMKVDLELKCLVDRMNGVDDNIIDNSSAATAAALVNSATAAATSVNTVMPQTNRNDNMGTIGLPATTTNTQQISRAQAAINDALVEKMMFSQNDAVGANNNDDGNDVRWVPPTSSGDKDVRHGKRDSHSDDSYGKKRNEGHKRRRNRHQSRSRSRSADRHEQDDEDRGRKRKRKHGSHRRRDERKKRKRRYRSRSPQSSSAESLSSRSISRERSKRKHRRDRHSHKRRRHKSSRGKERKKSSSKRRHRSRRERSTSFSSSSSSSSKSVDDTITIGRRFEPPTTLSQPSQQSLGEKTKEDFGLRFEPPSENKASSDEKLSGASRRQLAFIPPSRSDKTGSDESMKSKMQQRFVPKKSG